LRERERELLGYFVREGGMIGSFEERVSVARILRERKREMLVSFE